MYTHEIQVRVRYGETDQMGYVYYGNYAQYYEIGRVEALRSLGITYAELESRMSVFMPVMSLSVRYLRPARYDDLITIKTHVIRMPARDIVFLSEIFNAEERLLNSGRVTLCFLEIGSEKRVDVPAIIREKLQAYFSEDQSL